MFGSVEDARYGLPSSSSSTYPSGKTSQPAILPMQPCTACRSVTPWKITSFSIWSTGSRSSVYKHTTREPLPRMASSRIFVRGLPPSLSDSDFKQHFAAAGSVTDAKLLAKRRIGFVGFKTEQEAARAVKFFNKSFIRMSRLGVELAQSVSCESSLLVTHS